RMDDGQYVDAPFQEVLAELGGDDRVARNNRHDGKALAGPDIQSRVSGAFEKEPTASLEALYPLRLLQHHLNGRQGGCREGRRHADAIDEARRRILQILNEVCPPGDIATAGGECLAERAHPYVDLVGIDTAMFGDSASVLAKNADGVSFVDQQDGIMASLDVDEGGEIRKVAVHRIDPFQQNQDAFIAAALVLKNAVGCLVVIMREG